MSVFTRVKRSYALKTRIQITRKNYTVSGGDQTRCLIVTIEVKY